MTGWPDETRPGVPLNPERAGYHWLWHSVLREPVARYWRGRDHTRPEDGWENYADNVSRYLGPCLTPAEVEARERAAWDRACEAMREKAAEAVRFHIQETNPSPGLACDLMDAIRALPAPEWKL